MDGQSQRVRQNSKNNMPSFTLQNIFRITVRRMSKVIDTQDWDGVHEQERIGYVPSYYLPDKEIEKYVWPPSDIP